jgi:hypothetical protein
MPMEASSLAPASFPPEFAAFFAPVFVAPASGQAASPLVEFAVADALPAAESVAAARALLEGSLDGQQVGLAPDDLAARPLDDHFAPAESLDVPLPADSARNGCLAAPVCWSVDWESDDCLAALTAVDRSAQASHLDDSAQADFAADGCSAG